MRQTRLRISIRLENHQPLVLVRQMDVASIEDRIRRIALLVRDLAGSAGVQHLDAVPKIGHVEVIACAADTIGLASVVEEANLLGRAPIRDVQYADPGPVAPR